MATLKRCFETNRQSYSRVNYKVAVAAVLGGKTLHEQANVLSNTHQDIKSVKSKNFNKLLRFRNYKLRTSI